MLSFTVAGARTSMDTVADYKELAKTLSESVFVAEEIKPILKKVISSWDKTLSDDYFSHWCFNNCSNRQVAKAESRKNHYRLTDENLEAFSSSVQAAIDDGN